MIISIIFCTLTVAYIGYLVWFSVKLHNIRKHKEAFDSSGITVRVNPQKGKYQLSNSFVDSSGTFIVLFEEKKEEPSDIMVYEY